MNGFPKTLEEHFRHFLSCPDLILRMRSDWGAKQPNFREKLRHGIWQELAGGQQRQDSVRDRRNLLDLEELPSLEGHFISISHCQDFGGFVATTKGPVGFDIEIVKRVTTAAMERMATREEVQQAPSVASLWVAKEAAFKALRWGSQPSTISQIETTGWRKHPSLYESFTIKNPERFASPSGDFSKGLGVVIAHEIYLFCIYLG
jgi:4'-phosphopantetheinyl transferase